jgi:hypothetical protein
VQGGLLTVSDAKKGTWKGNAMIDLLEMEEETLEEEMDVEPSLIVFVSEAAFFAQMRWLCIIVRTMQERVQNG